MPIMPSSSSSSMALFEDEVFNDFFSSLSSDEGDLDFLGELLASPSVVDDLEDSEESFFCFLGFDLRISGISSLSRL